MYPSSLNTKSLRVLTIFASQFGYFVDVISRTIVLLTNFAGKSLLNLRTLG